MIDLHCHVLHGIDDGPELLEESLVMARAAYAAGTRVLVATPHVSNAYPNDADMIATRLGELRARISSEDVPLELRPGAEVALSRALALPQQELARYSLGAGPWLLLEPPFNPAAGDLAPRFDALLERGQRIVLAHPERCPAFHRNPAMLRTLVQRGCLASLTAGSLVGRFGERVRRFAHALLREGLAHNVASDAHDRYARAPGTAEALERSGTGALAQWLTCDVPAAILEGSEIPQRPDVELPSLERPRRWRWRRLGSVRAS